MFTFYIFIPLIDRLFKTFITVMYYVSHYYKNKQA